MKHPDRLLESSDSELERMLLRAGRDHAPRGAKGRALAAATGVIAATTLTAGNAAGAALAGKATAGTSTLLSLKMIVVVGVASVGVAAGAVAVQVARTAPSAVVTASSSHTRPAAPRPAAAAAAPEPDTAPDPQVLPTEPIAPSPIASAAIAPAVAVSPLPAVAPPPPARVLAPAVRAVASSGSTSAAELSMLDQARSAIGAGDAARGLTILHAYVSRFPHGVMAPEASILRIEALVKAGDRSAAKREADAFLGANPSSPYAPRIQSLLGTSNP